LAGSVSMPGGTQPGCIVIASSSRLAAARPLTPA